MDPAPKTDAGLGARPPAGPGQSPGLALPPEFALIARHFRALAGPGARDLADDVAVLLPPPGRELVLSADAMVEGVHFLADDPVETLGRKLLRTNLSDIAAKGATPLAYLMTISVPRTTPDAWFAAFAAGLALDQAAFGIFLLGGDTTATPGPISLSLTIIGHVAPGSAPSRSGARPGDGIWVTGTIGDGALGLAVGQNRLVDTTGYLLDRYRLPRPRLGLPVSTWANAAMDVSDGLVQDLSHICRASGVAARVEAALVPLSPQARDAGPDWLNTCLTGGDDYELLLAVSPEREKELFSVAASGAIQLSRIGGFVEGNSEVILIGKDGRPMTVSKPGYSHF